MNGKKKQAQLTDGKVVEYYETANPPNGQQKETYFGPDRHYVVQFYKDSGQNDGPRLARLQEIIHGTRNITKAEAAGGAVGISPQAAAHFRQLFCWPTGIVQAPRRGIVAPCFPSKYFFAGGKINKSRDGFWGGMTLDFISRLKSDIAFVGAVGVDVKENSVSTYDIDDGINKAAIIRHSKKAYVVAEARKLSTDGNYNYTTLDTLSGLITDSEPAADIRAAADSYGVEIILP